jgi:hypothetical protein
MVSWRLLFATVAVTSTVTLLAEHTDYAKLNREARERATRRTAALLSPSASKTVVPSDRSNTLIPELPVDKDVKPADLAAELSRAHKRFFDDTDKNFDKKMSQEEFFNVYKLLGTEAQAMHMWDMYLKRDKNGDGLLSWIEFKTELRLR